MVLTVSKYWLKIVRFGLGSAAKNVCTLIICKALKFMLIVVRFTLVVPLRLLISALNHSSLLTPNILQLCYNQSLSVMWAQMPK